jgi:uncharacterized protein
VAIQGASTSPVEASEQAVAQTDQAKSIDPAKKADIRSLLELTGAKDSIQDAAVAAADQYRQKVMETAASSDRAQAFANAYFGEFQKRFDANEVSEQLVGIYDKHFTHEEIKALLEFYGSPLGQKVAAAMPQISREVQAAMRNAGNQAARQAWQDLRAEYPSAGEPPKPFAPRRRNFGANGAGQQQTAGQQAQADPSQP